MSEPADSAPFSFVEMEHDILKLWQDTDAFQQSLANTQGKKPYISTAARRSPRVCRIMATWLPARSKMWCRATGR